MKCRTNCLSADGICEKFEAPCIKEMCSAFQPPMTNADCIRALNDEHLANYLMQFTDLDCRIGFCKELEECNIQLETEDGIPAAKCEKCLLEWLRKPLEVSE